MYRNCICKFQLFKLFKIIFHNTLIIKLYSHLLHECINLCNYSCITVKYSASGIVCHSVFTLLFPFRLVIIFNLHNFISLTECDFAIHFFLFSCLWRI